LKGIPQKDGMSLQGLARRHGGGTARGAEAQGGAE
jgi:hypothetical protein